MTKIQNGQAEYGVVHVQEEEMRAAQQGVFEPHSGEAKRARKASTPKTDSKTISADTVKPAPARKGK